MRQPAHPRPSDIEETQRVLRVYDWLREELVKADRGYASADTVLIVAERIAARTNPA